jgi:hypothetical protein
MSRTCALVAAVLVLAACAEGPQGSATPTETPSAAAGCPESFPAPDGDPWVPAEPTTETPGRLVPDADPVEALVCRYGDVFEVDTAALQGEVVLERGLDRIRTDLLVPARVEAAERACTQIGGGQVPHLVRLRYADGELWLSAVQDPNRCTGTGNGDFVSSAYLGDRLAQAYDTAAWPAQDPDPCARGGLGRAGEEGALVPGGWASLVLCEEDGRARELPADRAVQVADLLAQLHGQPGTNACEGVPTAVRRLVFGYEQGPPSVVVWTPGCEPSLGNGSRSALPTPAQTELLALLVG